MAVAGINNVSMLESSYSCDNYSPLSRRWGNQEKPITRTSFIRKLWRDLEDESKIREPERKQTSGVRTSNMESQCSCSSEGSESEDMSINTSEAENECPFDQNQMGIHNEQEENHKPCLQHSPAIGLAEKERVRQVFREWGSKNNSSTSHNNNCSRAQSICENESKRVRTVRQWLESNNQQPETGQSVTEEQYGVCVNQTQVGAQTSIRRLYGRHVLLDLLTRFQMERKREMQSLLENRPVSTFTHRKRIQTLLKGRFLWNQRFVQEEKCSFTAASELGLLRQTQTVSDLRKGFLSKVNTHEQVHNGLHLDTSCHNAMKDQENQLQDDIVNEYESEGLHSPPSTETFESRDQCLDHDLEQGEDSMVERNQGAHNIEPCQQFMELESLCDSDEVELQDETFDNINSSEPDTGTAGLVELNHGPYCIEPVQQSMELKSPYESDVDDLDETFNHLNPSETDTDRLIDTESVQSLNANSVENPDEWLNQVQSLNANSVENPDEWLNQETVHDGLYDSHPMVTTDEFYTHDVDDYDGNNNTRLELQQLMTRRRVSNLLQSDFHVRLNQILQSRLEHQDQPFEPEEDWTLDEDEHEDENDSWQHSGTEWEMINGLRMDMIQLHERMNHIQSTLETCMKMQLELQQSVQQEVSSALNPTSNSEGLQSCFLCCNSEFDFSPNRCGHVYVCSNCAEKINWSKLKESLKHP